MQGVYADRLLKYEGRGFSIVFPGLRSSADFRAPFSIGTGLDAAFYEHNHMAFSPQLRSNRRLADPGLCSVDFSLVEPNTVIWRNCTKEPLLLDTSPSNVLLISRRNFRDMSPSAYSGPSDIAGAPLHNIHCAALGLDSLVVMEASTVQQLIKSPTVIRSDEVQCVRRTHSRYRSRSRCYLRTCCPPSARRRTSLSPCITCASCLGVAQWPIAC